MEGSETGVFVRRAGERGSLGKGGESARQPKCFVKFHACMRRAVDGRERRSTNLGTELERAQSGAARRCGAVPDAWHGRRRRRGRGYHRVVASTASASASGQVRPYARSAPRPRPKARRPEPNAQSLKPKAQVRNYHSPGESQGGGKSGTGERREAGAEGRRRRVVDGQGLASRARGSRESGARAAHQSATVTQASRRSTGGSCVGGR